MQCISSLQYLLVLCDPTVQNSGLIGWVPHSDILYTLIREYRERKKVMLSMEHRLVLQVGMGGGRWRLRGWGG